MTLTGDSVPRWARGVRLREDAARERWVILAPERLFEPDETALTVLRLIDGTRTVDHIVTILAADFDAPHAEIEADVMSLLRELATRHVIAA